VLLPVEAACRRESADGRGHFTGACQ